MSIESQSNSLTDQQKEDVGMVVASGCDRETAAKYARTTWAAIHATMSEDRTFAARVRHLEARAELRHMLQIQKASEKEANWRTSVWWLEALAPERYGPRGTGIVNTKQLKLYLEHVATTLVVEIHNNEDRERLLAKLQHTAVMLDLFLRDESVPERPSTAAILLSENVTGSNDEPPTAAGVTTTAAEEENT
jgi:hypothetical protein